MAEEWRESSSLRSISKDTSAKLSLGTLVSVIVAIAGAVWFARTRLGDIEWELRSTKAAVTDLPTRTELRELELRVTGALRKQMKHAILRCPRTAARAGAGAWMDCQVVFPQPEE